MSKKPADPELDRHLAERLPLLVQEARDARANGNRSVEEQKSQTINIALGRWAEREH